MPSDSVASFLDRVRTDRVVFPDEVEQLIRRPGVPQSNLAELCDHLEERGALTRFQAAALRAGRGDDLTFAGYPVLDELGPCPGGAAFRVLHPSLRTPLVLRRFRADALVPADSPTTLVQRARAAADLHHPHLVSPVEAGYHRDEPYATVETPTDAADLGSLVAAIGPMPEFLAAEYAREVASALRVIHERGLWHGDVRPANVLVGPLAAKPQPDGTTKPQPAGDATAKLTEFGLVPVRLPAAVSPPGADEWPYWPPERTHAPVYDPRGDLFGLGATLAFALTGRPPDRDESTSRTLATVRPDVHPELVALVHTLLAPNPTDRPPTAFDTEQALVRFCRPETLPPAPEGSPSLTATPLPANPPSDEWKVGSETFSTAHVEPRIVAPRPATRQDRRRTRLWVAVGLLLQLLAITGWVYLAGRNGCFDSSGPPPERNDPPKRVPPTPVPNETP